MFSVINVKKIKNNMLFYDENLKSHLSLCFLMTKLFSLFHQFIWRKDNISIVKA